MYRDIVFFVLLSIMHRSFVTSNPQTIYFTPAPPATTPATNSTQARFLFPAFPKIVFIKGSTNPPACTCVLSGTCPTQKPVFDIRIVNQVQNPTCPAGYVCCAITPTVPPPFPIQDGTCGKVKIAPTKPSVTGVAGFGQYPWQATILTLDNAYIGSGTLMDDTHILTVAHKVANLQPANFKIRLGEWDAQAISEPYPFLEFSPKSVTVHPNYNSGNLQNDVAIIKLNGIVPIATSPNINTACRPISKPATGTRCWVSGWGKDNFGPTGSYQRILKEVDVPILDQSACEQSLRVTRLGQYFNLDRNSFICAGGEVGKDACTGDGGSPLVCNSTAGQMQVVGMVAWGIGCASSGVPGVYVNVFNFLPWINQQLATT